jgi:hypothetical protein
MVRDLKAAGFPPHADAFGVLQDCARLMDDHLFCNDDAHCQILWRWYFTALNVIEGGYRVEGRQIAVAALAHKRMLMMGLVDEG